MPISEDGSFGGDNQLELSSKERHPDNQEDDGGYYLAKEGEVVQNRCMSWRNKPMPSVYEAILIA